VCPNGNAHANDGGQLNIEAVLNQSLTPAQAAAARDAAAAVLTLACAGSGKSRTLAFRIAHLLASGEPAAGVVAFTFTEKAAESIKRRVAGALDAVGIEPAVLGAMYIGTIHSYCKFILGEMDARYRQFDVLDDNRLKLFLISRFAALDLHHLRGARGARYFETVKEVSDAWKTMNDEVVSIDDVTAHDARLGEVLQRLNDRLNVDHFIDFSLMIRLVVGALQAGEPGATRATQRLRHLMVDEYQDVNPAQEALIQQLRQRCQTMFVVGDDDQAIYGWRGADVSNILEFQNNHPGCSTHTLSHNFRSTPAIVAVADEFVAQELGPGRIAKNPQATQPPGSRDFRKLWFPARHDEAEWVGSRIQALLGTRYVEVDGTVRGLTPGDFAVLMRSTRTNEPNGSPRHTAFTQALDARHILYTLEAGGGVFDRPHVAVLRDTFELLRDGSPTRQTVLAHFNNVVLASFPAAARNRVIAVLAEWGRLIHGPAGGPRRRVYPQQLVHDLLSAFGLAQSNFPDPVMQDLGVFSRMIQDVEAVYLSIDSARRFQEILNFLQNVAESGYDSATEEVLRRPDQVTVSTIHKVKGLEFPVVFVVDVEAQRFPGNRRRYLGWLPAAVIQPALARGAYQSTPHEEARLFYTSLTRAERYLYVTGSAQLPGGRRPWQRSSFWLRLANPEISLDPQGLPAGLEQHPQVPRIDEAVMPTSYSDIRYYLACPRDYRFRKGFGFSPPVPELFGFGMTVHTAVGKLHEIFRNEAPAPGEAEALGRDIFHLKHVPPSGDPVNRPGAYERARDRAGQIVETYAQAYAQDFTRQRQVEARFEVPIDQAVISGSIDLLLQTDEEGNILEASVVDFKTMEGGAEAAENEDLQWSELALQVQLYAKAAREVLGENARTGAVHLLRDNQRVHVPVTDDAVAAAVANVEWAVSRILAEDFPMRPHPQKCGACDFRALCPRTPQTFGVADTPPPIQTPAGAEMARAFDQFQP
jgi:DNA helicase-2/ATP-dependent DNA helicase PcrA